MIRVNPRYPRYQCSIKGSWRITIAVKKILESCEKLRKAEKEELAAENIQQSMLLDFPELSDAELVANTDEVFFEHDQREVKDRHA